jgi:hypothetical protein
MRIPEFFTLAAMVSLAAAPLHDKTTHHSFSTVISSNYSVIQEAGL